MPLIQMPNGKQQFLDGNGDPLAAGSVYMYVPGTTTFKNTWSDPNQTTLNANPILLDANGEAVIFGLGQYRQVVYDLNGVLQWDQVVQGFWSGMNSLTTYVSAPYSSSGTISNSNGALNGFSYQSLDLNWIRYYLTAQIITNGTGSGNLLLNLPFASGVTSSWFVARQGAAAGFCSASISQGSTILQLSDSGGGYPGLDGVSFFGELNMPIL